MKILFTLFIYFILADAALAQSDGSINYQAIVRDNNGVVIANHTVSFRFSILHNGISGTMVYEETQAGLTNQFGLITLALGGGTAISGNFFFDRLELRIILAENRDGSGGGSSYILMGTEKFLAVPYANYSKTAGSVANAGPGLTNVRALSQSQIDTLNAIAGVCCVEYHDQLPELFHRIQLDGIMRELHTAAHSRKCRTGSDLDGQ